MTTNAPADEADLQSLVERLLVRDVDAHAEAVSELAARGDERVVPHLIELLVVDSIANDWATFGFPEVLRERAPPRYLELPEVRWPGVLDALLDLADADFDSEYAWVEWETWYSQQEIEPLDGFEEWKFRLYRSYLPPVGSLLDTEPRDFDMAAIRWGNCDRSFLAALNAPTFVPGEAVAVAGAGDGPADGASQGAAGDTDDPERYLADDDTVFGFELDGVAYAVPRWVLFPHEMLNAELGGVPVSLTYCTLCNAPILYDRRVGDRTLTFGNSGMLLGGNKVMYDEETETLWNQHVGVPIGGHYLAEDPDLLLEQFPVTQTEWGDWVAEYPDTLALDLDTGYDYDYRHYDGDLGIFRHYWESEEAVQPGVRVEDSELSETARVYGLVAEDGNEVWVVPESTLEDEGVLAGSVDGRDVVAVLDATGDVAVFEGVPTPVERTDSGVRDGEGVEWTLSRNALTAAGDAGERRARVAGRHGLWFAFRTHYDAAHILGS